MSESDRRHSFIREFPENGLKYLLSRPANVEDLLRIAAREASGPLEIERLDFGRMRVVSAEFIDLEYRRRQSDVLLTVPLRGSAAERECEREILVYILIEHQSTIDRLMPLRLLRSVVRIYDRQMREWEDAGRPRERPPLRPVLPVVLYSGERRWGPFGSIVDLVEAGEAFAAVTPSLTPLFVNLESMPAEALEAEGGALGWVLRLVKEQRAGAGEFQGLLDRVLQRLGAMSRRDEERWFELLSYLHALVYHRREGAEVPALERMILSCARTEEQSRELSSMGQTYAEYLEQKGIEKGREEGREKGREEGEIRSRRAILMRLLRSRFGEVPAEVAARIEATSDIAALDRWLDRILDAESIADVGIL